MGSGIFVHKRTPFADCVMTMLVFSLNTYVVLVVVFILFPEQRCEFNAEDGQHREGSWEKDRQVPIIPPKQEDNQSHEHRHAIFFESTEPVHFVLVAVFVAVVLLVVVGVVGCCRCFAEILTLPASCTRGNAGPAGALSLSSSASQKSEKINSLLTTAAKNTQAQHISRKCTWVEQDVFFRKRRFQSCLREPQTTHHAIPKNQFQLNGGD